MKIKTLENIIGVCGVVGFLCLPFITLGLFSKFPEERVCAFAIIPAVACIGIAIICTSEIDKIKMSSELTQNKKVKGK